MSGGLEGRRWFGASVALGVGAPIVVGLGLVLTLFVSLLVGSSLPQWAFSALWVVGSVATCVPLWELVRRCVDVGRWRTLSLGVSIASLSAIAAYAVGAVTQAMRPGVSGMGGVAWVFLGYVLGATCLVAFVMGAVAIAVRRPREAPAPTEPAS